MKEIYQHKRLWLGCLAFVAAAGGAFPAGAAEVACTESPDCASLGYTRTAAQCPDGGIKCPFDGNKMFCVSGDSVDYVFQNQINLYDVAYSDGTTSSSYNANKLAIGLVYYVHPNGNKNHGWLMTLEQFPAQSRAEAIKRCAGFSTKGTRAGDWHLPDIGELMMMSSGNDSTGEYASLNSAIKKVPGSMQLGSTYSEHYCLSGAADISKTYISGSPSCSDTAKSVSWSGSCTNNFTAADTNRYGSIAIYCTNNSGCSNIGSNDFGSASSYTGSKSCTATGTSNCPSLPKTLTYSSPYYWSSSDQPGSSNWLYGNLSSTSGWASGSSMSAKYGHYRCVANF